MVLSNKKNRLSLVRTMYFVLDFLLLWCTHEDSTTLPTVQRDTFQIDWGF